MKRILLALLISLLYCSISFAGWQTETQEAPWKYSFVSSQSVTNVKSGPGTLHSIIVNGGTSGTIQIFDSTTYGGTIIAAFDATNTIAIIPFDIVFSSGCTVVTNSGTKITILYR